MNFRYSSAQKILIGFFVRQERTISSRIGAMQPIGQLLSDSSRWQKELQKDLANVGSFDSEMAQNLAKHVIEETYKLLSEWVKPHQCKEERIQIASMVYADLVTRSSSLIVNILSPTIVTEDGKFILYKLYDDMGQLLYVGITDRGPQRLVEHYRNKEWFPLVTRIEFERFFTRDEVLAREKRDIQMFQPIHNIQHNMNIDLHSEVVTAEA